MLSLRELFDKIPHDHIHPDSYAFLKGVLDELEAQECPQGCDATIRKLREERDQATGERKNLLESCRWWKQRCMNAEEELTAALAEIPRLETERDEALRELRVAHGTLVDLCKERDEANAERDSWERQCRSAEHRLARTKVQVESLCKSRQEWRQRYSNAECELAKARVTHSRPPLEEILKGNVEDASEANIQSLRAIQEVGDA